MKCEKASEITAYLQGEGSEEERGMLRRHFEQCEACARELAQFERAFGALGNIETIEPSADFQKRVEQAFVRAHPKFAPKPRFRLLPALAAAAALLFAVVGAVLVLRRSDADGHGKIAHVEPEVFPDDDPQYRTLPKTELPSKIDASAWGEALAYDRRLIESTRAPLESDAALHWLAVRQEPDGSWKGSTADETIELTGLALLALARSPEEGLAARKAVAFLRSRQRDSGAIGGGSPESHAIATLALQEVAIRGRDPSAIRAASKGIAMIAQQNSGGPWGRGLVAGWQFHVLRLAVATGDRALTETLVRGHDPLVDHDGQKKVDAASRAAGQRAILWTDPKPDPKRWAVEAAWLLEGSPFPGTEPANFYRNDLRLAYFGSALLAPLGGDAWKKWWSPLQTKLQKTQGSDGSWPAGLESGKGQIYVTALCSLILQVPSRMPPLDE
ncbi:MAG: hypothetical protein HY293_20740 [Planctomycetes bacterium]|nr:hypothetical protein [Planctomycetota bacterium]